MAAQNAANVYDRMYNVIPRPQGEIGDAVRPPLLATVREAQNLGHRIQDLQIDMRGAIPAEVPLTATGQRQSLMLIASQPRDNRGLTPGFHDTTSWILHLLRHTNGNSPAQNLSVFFSLLCHYMPVLRNILADYIINADIFEIRNLPINEFLMEMDAIDMENTAVDPQALCDHVNDKGRLVLGLNCLLIGKYLSLTNHSNWFQKRIKSMAGTLSIRAEYLDGFTPFGMSYCQDIYGTLSAHKELRAKIFNVIYQLSQKTNSLQSVMIAVCNLLSGCEMTGFLLVYRVLLHENPLLFYLYDLNCLAGDLQIALRVFKSFQEKKMYTKLLISPEVGKIFNSAAIGKLAKVARSIAIDSGETSLRQYAMEDPTDGEKILIERVKYFKKLLSGSVSTEGDKIRGAFMADTEQNKAILAAVYANAFQNVENAIAGEGPIEPQFDAAHNI